MQLVDQEARLRAQSELDQSFTVEAGAGTGKTTLLARRFFECVQSKHLSPQNVVAITFSEKAAWELKNRIRNLFIEADLPQKAEQLESAPISTIHAFASSILRERPFEAGVDPQFSQLDPLAERGFLKDVFDQWLSRELSSENSAVARSMQLGLTPAKLEDLALGVYRYRDLTPFFKKASLRVIPYVFYSDLLKRVSELFTRAESDCQDFSDAGFLSLQALHHELQNLKEAPLSALERTLTHRLAIRPNKGSQKNWGRAQTLKDIKQELKSLQQEHNTYCERARSGVLDDVFPALLRCTQAFEDEKKKQKLLDFDDLLFRARDVLKNHPKVRESFKNKFQSLLVDEFQDTDPVQAELIWLLSSSAKASDWKQLTPDDGRLFVVGDPKQSIYRFRRASVETYFEATKAFAKKNHLYIRQNFRSNRRVIGWVNDVFSKLLGDHYQALEARPEYESIDRPIIELTPGELEGSESAADLRRLEAETLAKWICKAVDEKERIVFDNESKNFRAPRYGDFAVLFPTSTGLDQLEEALRRYQLPFSVEGGSSFFHRVEIDGLIRVLETLLYPHEMISTVAALKSTYFTLSDQDLYDLCKSNPKFDYRQNVSGQIPATEWALGILRDLHYDVSSLSISECIELFLEKTYAYPMLAHRFHGEQACANIEKFLGLARHFEENVSKFLIDFVDWCRLTGQENSPETEAILTEDDGSHIRLQTIHRSKGLEFPITILCQMGSSANKNDLVLADRLKQELELGFGPKDQRWATPGYAQSLEEEQETLLGERKRLLYVAATRAKDILVVSRFSPKRASKNSFLNLLEEGWADDHPYVRRVSTDDLDDVQVENKDKPSRSNLKPVQSEAAFTKGFENREQAFSESRVVIDTPSSIEKPRSRSTNLAKNAVFENIREDTGQGAALGSCFHAIMERISLNGEAAVEEKIQHELRARNLMEFEHEIKPWVDQTLKSSIWTRAQASSECYQEYPFVDRVGPNHFVEGFIDLMFKEEGQWVIVDYKTDRIRSSAKELAISYAGQAKRYSEIIEKLSQTPVKETSLYFVRSNEQIQI